MYGGGTVQIYSYGLQPYYGYSNHDVVELIRTNQLLSCPPGCPPCLYALLVDCWHPVPSTRPRFDAVRRRLRDCAGGNGSVSNGSATTAGCCGTADRALYPPRSPVCPPTACLQHATDAAEQYSNAVDACPPPDRRPDDAIRWSIVDAVGTDVGPGGGGPRQPSSPAVGGGGSTAANRSASTTPRNSHHQAPSSSSSASEAKSRRVTSSELDRLTSRPRLR